LPFGLALAAGGLDAVMSDPHLAAGLNVHRGTITNKAVAESLGVSFVAPHAALAA
jgi:alanine dehydrogenase